MARKAGPPAKSGKPDDTTGSPPSSDENGLKDALDKRIGPLVPQSQRAEIVTRIHTLLVSEKFSGPMPHPRHLREYEDILPGSAERILRMAEESLAANQKMDEMIVRGGIADATRGMNYGLLAFLASLAGALICAAIGQPILGGGFLASSIMGAVAVFIKGRFGK